jgi:hypothetical protein
VVVFVIQISSRRMPLSESFAETKNEILPVRLWIVVTSFMPPELTPMFTPNSGSTSNPRVGAVSSVSPDRNSALWWAVAVAASARRQSEGQQEETSPSAEHDCASFRHRDAEPRAKSVFLFAGVDESNALALVLEADPVGPCRFFHPRPCTRPSKRSFPRRETHL